MQGFFSQLPSGNAEIHNQHIGANLSICLKLITFLRPLEPIES